MALSRRPSSYITNDFQRNTPVFTESSLEVVSVMLHLHPLCASRPVYHWYLGFTPKERSFILTLCWNGCIVLNYWQMLIGNRKVNQTSTHSWHLFSVYSTSRPRPSSAFCSNLCLYCCNLSNSWAAKWRLHQNNSAQVNTYWSDGWRLPHHVSWLTVGASDSWCLLSFFLPHQTTPVQEEEQRRPTVTLNMAPSWRGNWVTALHRSP